LRVFEEYVGCRSNPVHNRVEAGAVRRFAEAIGDPNPLYFDESAARSSRWGRRIAPPTFPRTFDYGQIEGLRLPTSGIIHGEQEYVYRRPIIVGEELVCWGTFVDSYSKSGREGTLNFLVFERVAEDLSGNEVMRTREVYILLPAVADRTP
jgi:acyl dehydratase